MIVDDYPLFKHDVTNQTTEIMKREQTLDTNDDFVWIKRYVMKSIPEK